MSLVNETRFLQLSPATRLGLKDFPFVEQLRPIPSLKHSISPVLPQTSFPIDRVLVQPDELAFQSVLL